LQNIELKIDSIDSKFEKQFEHMDIKLDRQCEKCPSSVLLKAQALHVNDQIGDIKNDIRELKHGNHGR
jgi:hypothetical protein